MGTNPSRGVIVAAIVLGLWLLHPGEVRAQGDEKDKLIEKQQRLLRDKEREIELLRQRDLDRLNLIDALKEKQEKQFALLQKQVKDQNDLLAALAKSKDVAFQELLSAIKARNHAILQLEADLKKQQVEIINLEAALKVQRMYSEMLLETLRERHLLEKGTLPVRDPNEPNPPPVNVRGKIEKVDKDLLQISLGTDHGLKKNHTLDVFRLTPQPKYLGMIRILDANGQTSVGRLIPAGSVATQLQAGDLVASRLTKDDAKAKDSPKK